MMIFKSVFLFLGAVGLTSGQYINHHQQVLYEPNNYLSEEVRFDTKALTPVGQIDQKRFKWAFVSTYQKRVNNDVTDNPLELVLVKLGENTPIDAPFTIESSRRYITDLTSNKKWNIDVEDVIYDNSDNNENRWKYVVCGQVSRYKAPNNNVLPQGFIMTIRAAGPNEGNVWKRKRYPNVKILKSIVKTHGPEGYIAVGQLQEETTPTQIYQDAVYLTVQRLNLDVMCAQRTRVHFSGQGKATLARWNKVIQYKRPNADVDFLYALVGETESFDQDFNTPNFYNQKECRKDGDVLVGILGTKFDPASGQASCGNVWANRYGLEFEGDERVHERGLSIAQFSVEKGGLVITGNTKMVGFFDPDTNTCKVRYNDVLAFKIGSDGILGTGGGNDIDWWRRYDISNNSASPDFPDIGTAVQMSTNPNHTQTVLVAGEYATRWNFGSVIDGSADAFLLSINKDNGSPIIRDSFFMEDNIGNGALYQGYGLNYQGRISKGNLDLHMTVDHHAVIMGNAKVTYDNFGNTVLRPNSYDQSNPYIIERYDTIEDKCLSERKEIDSNKAEPKITKTETDVIEVGQRGFKVKMEEMKLTQEIVCEKTEKEPTPEPTAEPTRAPNDEPTQVDPTAEPTPEGTQVEPTAEPTRAPNDEPTQVEPTAEPTPEGTQGDPTPEPTPMKSQSPTECECTCEPTPAPTPVPTQSPIPILQPSIIVQPAIFQPFATKGPIGVMPIGWQPIGVQPIGVQPIGYQPIGKVPDDKWNKIEQKEQDRVTDYILVDQKDVLDPYDEDATACALCIGRCVLSGTGEGVCLEKCQRAGECPPT